VFSFLYHSPSPKTLDVQVPVVLKAARRFLIRSPFLKPLAGSKPARRF